jgi:predicted TIM-barrel fold metal-dependent hydrolase
MDELGIDVAVLSAVNSYLRPRGIADSRSMNDSLNAYCQLAPDRFVYASGIVEPCYGEVAVAETRRMREELGFIGVTFHPRLQGCSIDDVWIRAVVKEAAALGMISFIHSISGSSHEAPLLLRRVAEECPAAKIVCLDAFSSHYHSIECMAMAEGCGNVWFDVARMWNVDVLRMVVDRVGADRVVFGTNMYPGARSVGYITPSIIADGRLAATESAGILAGNFRRLVGREEAPVGVA